MLRTSLYRTHKVYVLVGVVTVSEFCLILGVPCCQGLLICTHYSELLQHSQIGKVGGLVLEQSESLRVSNILCSRELLLRSVHTFTNIIETSKAEILGTLNLRVSPIKEVDVTSE